MTGQPHSERLLPPLPFIYRWRRQVLLYIGGKDKYSVRHSTLLYGTNPWLCTEKRFNETAVESRHYLKHSSQLNGSFFFLFCCSAILCPSLLSSTFVGVCMCVAQIDVMDFDRIGAHGLIGRTVVDLEDRWFDQRWQVMTGNHAVSYRKPQRQSRL